MSVVGIFVLKSEISDYIVVTTHVFNKNTAATVSCPFTKGSTKIFSSGNNNNDICVL